LAREILGASSGEGEDLRMAFVPDQMTEEELPQVSPKIVQATFDRGLPSSRRGWRTPDPSPIRSGLPKCIPPGEYVLEDVYLDTECSTPRGHTVSTPRGRSREKEAEKTGHEEAAWPRLQTPSPEPEMRMTICVLNLSMLCLPHAEAPPTRTSATISTEVQKGCSVSLGSVGHPYSCAGACKYATKSNGCKDGANCDHCHLCKWTKTKARKKDTQATAMPLPVSGVSGVSEQRKEWQNVTGSLRPATH